MLMNFGVIAIFSMIAQSLLMHAPYLPSTTLLHSIRKNKTYTRSERLSCMHRDVIRGSLKHAYILEAPSPFQWVGLISMNSLFETFDKSYFSSPPFFDSLSKPSSYIKNSRNFKKLILFPLNRHNLLFQWLLLLFHLLHVQGLFLRPTKVSSHSCLILIQKACLSHPNFHRRLTHIHDDICTHFDDDMESRNSPIFVVPLSTHPANTRRWLLIHRGRSCFDGQLHKRRAKLCCPKTALAL